MTFRKHPHVIAAVIAAGLITASFIASAGDTPVADNGKTHDAFERDKVDTSFWSRLGIMKKWNQLVGLQVTDNKNHKLGKIADIVIDLHSGEAVCALIAPPSGTPDGLVPIPGWAFFNTAATATLRTEKASFNDSPLLPQSANDSESIAKIVSQSYRYFDLKSVWEMNTRRRELARCSQLIGKRVKGKAGEDLGAAINWMIDLPGNRAYFAIITQNVSEKKVYAVPPSAMLYDVQTAGFFLDSSPGKVIQSANNDGFFWTQIANAGWAGNVYRLYGQEPSALVASDLSRENVRTKVEDTSATLKPVQTDGEVTRSVLSSIASSDLGTAAYREIQVLSMNGQVTLRGRVKNKATKDKLGELAAKAAGSDKVDNQLEVGK